MLSELFSGDEILQAVLEDRDRISATQHRVSDATTAVQLALLIWDPTCLPAHGADGDYGDETAGAVVRFKAEVLLVPPDEIFPDVGPRTVERLDQIAATRERGLDDQVALIAVPGLDDLSSAALLDAVLAAGGNLLLSIGERTLVVDGGLPLADAVTQQVGELLSTVLGAGQGALPDDLDDVSVEAISAWLASLDPAFVLAQLQGWADPVSFAPLAGCGLSEQDG